MTDRLFTHAPDDAVERQAPGYQPISGLALLATLAGFASPLALLNPLVWFVPLLGIALAWAALHDLATADPPRRGRRWAIAGLILSCGWLAAAPTRYFALRTALRARAVAFGEQWFSTFQSNRPDLSFALTRAVTARPPLETPLVNLLEEEGFQKAYHGFLKRPHVALLVSHGPKLSVELAAHGPWRPGFDEDTLVETFAIRAPPELAEEMPYLRLYFRRTTDKATGEERWQVWHFVPVRTPDEE